MDAIHIQSTSVRTTNQPFEDKNLTQKVEHLHRGFSWKSKRVPPKATYASLTLIKLNIYLVNLINFKRQVYAFLYEKIYQV